MKKILPALLLLIFTSFFYGCYVNRQAIYVSPFNGNANTYHSIPLKSDSIQSAFFINAAYASGRVNFTSSAQSDSGFADEDDIKSFQFSISRTHNFGIFEAYYGFNFSLGNYTLNKFDSVNIDPTVNYKAINQYAGKKFFGGYGFSGGLNFVLPFAHGGEWRVVGFELSMMHEYGNYLQFRNQFPYSEATYVAKSNFFGTYGWFTEILFGSGHFGIKVGTGAIMGEQYNNLLIIDNDTQKPLKYQYSSASFTGVIDKFTIYAQLNTGTKATFMQFGTNYRIAKKKKSPQVNLY